MSVVAGWVCRALGAVKGPQATRFGFRQSKPFPRASYLRRTAVTSIPLSPTIIVAASVLNVRSYSTERMNSPPEKPEVVETGNLDFHDLINYASAHGPGFPVDASSVSVVREPSSFFDELAARISTAKKKVTLSSLYLGAEPKAMEMIAVIDKALSENPELEVTILLDCLRGSRNTVTPKTEQFCLPPGSPLQGLLSSVTLIYPLQIKYPDRFRSYYYHTPKLHGFLKAILPERYNELVGVQHTKCYLIDDDILISGANLSEQYFTNRQDRYIWIRQNPDLARFYRSLVSAICDLSFRVDDQTGQMVFPQGLPDPSDNPKAFNALVRSKLQALLQSRGSLPPIEQQAALSSGTAVSASDASQLLKSHDTWVFPTIQLGHANVRHDEQFTQYVLSHQPRTPYVTYLTSPYFNIAEPYEQALRSSNKPVRLIVASPKANGFFGAGVSGMVPWAYDTVLREWMENLPRNSDVEVYEYIREGWTFHAKGLWIEMPSSTEPHAKPPMESKSTQNGTESRSSTLEKASTSKPIEAPAETLTANSAAPSGPNGYFTLVGSSNFGTRSMARDLESQLAIFSTNESLGRILREERDYLFEGAPEVTLDTFEGRSENHSTFLKLVVPFASKFM